MPRRFKNRFTFTVDMKSVASVRSSFKFFKEYFSSFKMSCSSSKLTVFDIDSQSSFTSEGHRVMLNNIHDFIPKLTSNLHKGQCGRIGVIGGSFEYTGAPYFAAISSLKVGADLVHVFCPHEAGPVIKSYSPELIVHPFLDSKDVLGKIQPWLDKLHVLVIGPGMGRSPDLLKNVGLIISYCKEHMSTPPPLVIDADGLFLITENTNLIKNYNAPVILTPNEVEFQRLSLKLKEQEPLKIASKLNAIVLQKGRLDVITNGIHYERFNFPSEELVLVCDMPGSNRRCGGQGDILSGCVATFVAWLHIHLSPNFDFNCTVNKDNSQDQVELFRNSFLKFSWAVYGACIITKTCSRLAFNDSVRGMTASDMISYINIAFKIHFGL